ncbi:MAG TPA: hypothetical protein VGM30_18915 [Puia sp.]|jgi:hypothetical protein
MKSIMRLAFAGLLGLSMAAYAGGKPTKQTKEKQPCTQNCNKVCCPKGTCPQGCCDKKHV